VFKNRSIRKISWWGKACPKFARPPSHPNSRAAEGMVLIIVDGEWKTTLLRTKRSRF
jgi:hypothetical protein